MKLKTLLLLSLILPAWSADVFAQGPTTMNFDAGTIAVSVQCSFRYTTKITCADFVRGFFSHNGSIIRREKDALKGALSLTVTDESVTAAQVRYNVAWKSSDQIDVSDFTLTPVLDQAALDEVSMLNQLIQVSTKGLTLYLDVIQQKTDDGQIVIVYQPKGDEGTPEETWQDRLEKSPIYISADLTGNYHDQGTAPLNSSSFGISTKLEGDYLKDKYKVRVAGAYTYKKATVPTDDGYLSATNNAASISGLYVYSMKRRWNVAVMHTTMTDSAANTDVGTSTGVGTEWTLVPFRTTENKELAFRLGTTAETLDLKQANTLGHHSEQYFTLFTQVYFYWMFLDNKVTFKTNLGYEHALKYRGFDTYSVNGTLSYQVTRSTRLSASASYQYMPRSLTYPGTPDLSNSLQVQQMTGQDGKNLYINFGINFTIGNSLRKTRDRRWAQ